MCFLLNTFLIDVSLLYLQAQKDQLYWFWIPATLPSILAQLIGI